MDGIGIEPVSSGQQSAISSGNERRHEINMIQLAGSRESGRQSSRQKRDPDLSELENAAREINRQLLIFDRTINVRVDEETQEFIVKVIDAETGETIRQIPPDQVLRASALIRELKGILVDEFV